MKRYRRAIVCLGVLFGFLALGALLPKTPDADADPHAPHYTELSLHDRELPIEMQIGLVMRKRYNCQPQKIRSYSPTLHFVDCGGWTYTVSFRSDGIIQTN